MHEIGLATFLSSHTLEDVLLNEEVATGVGFAAAALCF
jgi:hypothetical protein